MHITLASSTVHCLQCYEQAILKPLCVNKYNDNRNQVSTSFSLVEKGGTKKPRGKARINSRYQTHIERKIYVHISVWVYIHSQIYFLTLFIERPYKQRGAWRNENNWQPHHGFKYCPPVKASRCA